MGDKSQLSSSDPGSFVPGGQGLDVREKAAYFHRRASQSEAIRDQNPEGIAAVSHYVATQNANKL